MKALSVLVIDDEPALEKVFSKYLEILGARVVFCDHPQKGWKAIDKEEYQLIITDLNMPIIKGDEFIKIVRNSRLNAHTPIILCSGQSDKLLMSELTNESKVYFLSKPFQNKALLDLIGKALVTKTDTTKGSLGLHEKWANHFMQELNKIGLGKVSQMQFEHFDLWNFESISLSFFIQSEAQSFGISLLMKPKTFLDIAGKMQGTHYKEMESETLLIWQKLLQESFPGTSRITFSKLVGQDFLTFPGQQIQFYVFNTDFGEVLAYLN